MKNWTLALCITAGLPVLSTAAPAADAPQAAVDEKPQPVNAKCPIMGGDAKATVTTTWKGKTIGFCCKPCIPKWNALSEEQKAKKLAASMADDAAVAAKPVNAKCPIMGGKAKGAVSTMWHGKTVGFCCPPCIPKWEALTEAQKARKLAASMK